MTLWQRGESPYVSNDTRGQCTCIYIAADRRLDYQLSYASKFTFLSKLMRKFHDRLMADTARADDLREKFSETKAIFLGVPEFAEFTSELQAQIAELSGNLQYGLEVDFSAYDPSNFFHALRVHASEGGEVRTIEELGSGQEQILALSFIKAYAKAFHDAEGLVLVIDEPEANLHPLAQDWLARRIRDLALSGVQVVVTVHSPAFLDVAAIPGLVLVRKNDGCTETVQMTAAELAQYCRDHGAARATAENILGFYRQQRQRRFLAPSSRARSCSSRGQLKPPRCPCTWSESVASWPRKGSPSSPSTGSGTWPSGGGCSRLTAFQPTLSSTMTRRTTRPARSVRISWQRSAFRKTVTQAT
jgi:putative ATP-dependent endonuclease of OLD family